jgi:hypothetical protein
MAFEWPAKTIFTLGTLVLAWATLAAALRSAECQFGGPVQAWVELANGATWPSDWHKTCKNNPGYFALLLAARTLLNFAGPLLVLISGIWLVTGGLNRLVFMNRKQAFSQLSSELVVRLYSTMRSLHPEIKPEGMQSDLEAMRREAAALVDGFANDMDRAESKKRNEAGGLLAR